MDFCMSRLPFAQELYASWESFCRYSVEKVIDETLSPFDKEDEILEVETLVVEVGQLSETDFYDKFPLLFRQKLYEEFAGLLVETNKKSSGNIRRRPIGMGQLDTYIFFLKYGYIPSGVPDRFCQPADLLNELIVSVPVELIQTLCNEWHHEGLKKRLIEQFRDESLFRILEIKEPMQAEFIRLFLNQTQVLNPLASNDRNEPAAFRLMLWTVTFSFLFFRNKSYFSRKEYLRYTLEELAAHHNMVYLDTLRLFIACYGKKDHGSGLFELQTLLQELYEDTDVQTLPLPDTETMQSVLHETNVILNPVSGMQLIYQQLLEGVRAGAISITSKDLQNFWELNVRQLGVSYILFIQNLRHSLLDAPKTVHTRSLLDLIQQTIDGNTLETISDSSERRISIGNAGLVLLSPYFPQLFRMLKLVEESSFLNPEAQLKAIFVLQELLCDGRMEYTENELLLNKLLTGYADYTQSLPLSILLSEEEKSFCFSLLEGSKNNWSKMKNTGVRGFCDSFLNRNGLLESKADHWLLTVENKAYDMLLDTLPWSYTPIKYAWMEKAIHVRWR
ncbi:hypothetical protein LJB80_01085 [Bacteroides sp. OttesenSCG-928-F21]|nr:hypothetical protein [Bacteroides sp. OttesenSCG-928-F21]